MNPAYRQILTASENDRRDLFLTAATRLGTAIQNVEKDFLVCWTLDALFNGLPPGGPRLLFKGGTSLSKGFGLISRFSEDIDITVFRDDLGQSASVEMFEGLSGKKQKAQLDAIKKACSAFILGPLADQLRSLAGSLDLTNPPTIDPDTDDRDGQSLLLCFPLVSNFEGSNLQRAVKIESGAKSALDPHQPLKIKPYIADDLPDMDLTVSNVVTVAPERTFWDKIIILHGLRRWFERKGELRGDGQRVSRHYYDVHCLLHSNLAEAALKNLDLGLNCVRHARMFFNRPDLDLDSAEPGSLALAPPPAMRDILHRDYINMAGMIFGEAPTFEQVIDSVSELEARLNSSS
ncbi:MAG: nucleotidyl transferase AbiEii/AbiGii toxin family protein [Methylacidiphilales bacterium]|nr:nucleotidyl transferase AbiEii/AbiGii toxin family protein [Candidatus Methylacidiphilales bacterium]